MTVPRTDGPGKKPPISDWEQRQRGLKRMDAQAFVVFDLGPAILSVCLIAALSIFVFWQNWNWWLIPIGVLAIVCILCALELTDVDGLANAAGILSGLCLVMMLFYGFYQIDTSGHEVTHKTALFCGLDTERDDDGNVYQIFRGPNGDYVINDGTYTVTDPKTGKTHKVFITTGKAAADTFHTDHAYSMTIDNFEGHNALDGITAAHEVPTNETCSNR